MASNKLARPHPAMKLGLQKVFAQSVRMALVSVRNAAKKGAFETLELYLKNGQFCKQAGLGRLHLQGSADEFESQ